MHTKKMSPQQEVDLQAWRSLALEKMPYMATMMFSLRPVDAPGLGTFAVDKRMRLYVDFDAVTGLGAAWCSDALLHECCHLFSEHSDRAVDMGVRRGEQKRSNFAADAEINDDLRVAGCAHKSWVFPETFGEPEFGTYEQYLEALRKIQDPSLEDGQDGDSDGQPGDSDGDSDGQPGDGEASWGGCGSGSGGAKAPVELDDDDDMDGTAPAASDVEMERVNIDTAASIRDHATQGWGNMPGGLVARAEAMLTPTRTPWRQLLASALRHSVAIKAGMFDSTHSRRNRRNTVTPFIMAGRFTPQPNIAVVRDTSGSMGSVGQDVVVSEIEGISKQVGVRGDSLRVLDVDTEVHATQRYTGTESVADMHGGGGTDMAAGVNAAYEMRPAPAAVVVITDGHTPWSGIDNHGLPVVVCIVGGGGEYVTEQVPDWMVTVIVED